MDAPQFSTALPIGDCRRCDEPVIRTTTGVLLGLVLRTPNCAGLGLGRLSGDDRRATLPHTLDAA